MNNLNIQDLILKNPWWSNPNYEISEVGWPKRDLYASLLRNLTNHLILSVVGLRRTGKSTLVKQLIGEILKKSQNSKNIFYYLFDYETQLKTPEFLDSVLSIYFNEIKQEKITYLKEKVYVFLDEVQYIDNWQAVLKKYYDLSNKRIKFIITGSQSLLLGKKNKESLAGRIFDFYLSPLSFDEYFKINEIAIAEAPKINLCQLEKDFTNLQMYDFENKQKLIADSKNFIINGQFPEIKELTTDEDKREYILESVLGKVLADIIRIGKVEKPDNLKLFLFHLLKNVGSLFELENIGRELGLSKNTTERYFDYLQETYLLEVLYKYHKSVIKQGRILKKVYTSCVNFTCALNYYEPKHFQEAPGVFGNIIENVVYNFLKMRYKDHLYFYRQGQKEIDFIILDKNKILALEVKFSQDISLGRVKTLVNYLFEKKISYGIVVTKDKLEKKKINNKLLYFVPYYLIMKLV